MVLLGNPGAGKSLFLLDIAQQILKEKYDK